MAVLRTQILDSRSKLSLPNDTVTTFRVELNALTEAGQH